MGMNFRQWLQLQGYARVRPSKCGTIRWLPMVKKLTKGLMMSIMHDDYLFPRSEEAGFDLMGDGKGFNLSEEQISEALEIFENREVGEEFLEEGKGIDRTYWDQERFNMFQMTNFRGPGISWMQSGHGQGGTPNLLTCGQIPPLNINEWPELVRDL